MTTHPGRRAKTDRTWNVNVLTSLALIAAWLVSATFSTAATVSVPTDFATIQEAVDNAIPGDIIVVADGTYDENVDLKQMGSALTLPAVGDLTINAANPLGATVNGGMGAAFRAAGYSGNITLSGFVLDADPGVATGVLSLTNIDGVVTVLDNTFGPGYGGAGVLMAVSGSTVTTLEVRGNLFETPADNQDAVEIEIVGAPSVNFIAEGNTFTMLQDDGIKIDVQSPSGPAGPVILGRIVNNIFNAAAGSGSPVDIDLGDGGSNGTSAWLAIEDNQITSPLSQAILIDVEGAATGTSVIIRNNQISDPAGNGIFIDGGSASADIVANLLIDANTVAGTGSGAGIRVRPQDASTGAGGLWKVVLTGNTITSPTGEGILIDADATNGVYTLDLDISGNTVQAPATSAYQIDRAFSTVQLEQGISASLDPATVIADNTNAGTPIVVNGTVTVAAGVIAAEDLPANLGDFVWSDADGDGIQDAGEPGAHAIPVALSGSVALSTTSDVNGVYLFPAQLPGSYTLTVSPPAETELSPEEQGGDTELDSNFDPADGQADVSFTLEDLSIDAGLRSFTPVSISGLVFEDLNGDGSPTGDPAFPMVTIELWRDGGDGAPDFGVGDDLAVGSTASGPAGLFGFSNVGGGRYFVRQIVPAGAVQTTTPAVFGVTTESGVDVTGLVFGNIRIVDIAVTVAESIDPVVAGSGAGNLVYTVTATNNGPADATGVTVSEVLTLPAGASVDSVVPSGAGSWAGPTWTIGDLAGGASETLTVTLTVAASTAAGSNVIGSTATVTALNETDTSAANDTSTETTSVSREVDLEVSTTESIDPVVAGSGAGNLVYTVTATNNGPSDASGVTLSEILTLPDGVTVDSVTPSAGSFADPTWTLGDVAAGASETLKVTLTVDNSTVFGTDVIDSTATITAVNETDTVPANDSASELTSVTREIDLVLDKTGSPDPWSPEATLVYTLTVTNQGPSDATGVEVTDTLPASVTLVSTSGCAEDPNGVPTCTLGAIAAGGSSQYTISVTVNPDPPPIITNTASVTANETELDAEDNTDDEETTTDTTPPTVTALQADPGAGELEACRTVLTPISSLRVTFSEAVRDPPGDSEGDDVTNPANYMVIGAGPDNDFSTAMCEGPLGDDEAIPLTAVSYDEPTRTATLVTGNLPSSQVRVLVCGSTSIRDIAGNPLDGTGDGTAGDDFVLTFRSDPFNTFTNGHFDCAATDLDGWSVSDPVEIIRDADDADGSTASGSARIMQLAANTLFEISQCVEVTPSAQYDLSGRVRLTTTSFISYSRSCEFYATTVCGAPATGLGKSINSDLMGGTGGTWIEVSDTMTTTAGASSARCALTFTTPGGQNFTAWLDDLFFGDGNLIFADGFESGDTTMWSLTTP